MGVDCRVTDNELYGLGDRGGIYRIGIQDGVATKVSQLTAPLEGESFDVDFNPAANQLRVVSDAGQTLRHDIDDRDGTAAAGSTLVDTPLRGPDSGFAEGVSGVGYDNDDDVPDTGTTSFVIDTATDEVMIQSPEGSGCSVPPAAWASTLPAATPTGSPTRCWTSTAPAGSTTSTCSPGRPT